MSSNEEALPNHLSAQYHCPFCGHTLDVPITLNCGRRRRRSSLISMRNDVVRCILCNNCEEVSNDRHRELQQQMERLTVTCSDCRTPECTKTPAPDLTRSPETTAESVNTSPLPILLSCPLASCGCVDKFSTNEKETHDMSGQHRTILNCALQSIELKVETTRDNCKINPGSPNESAAEKEAVTTFATVISKITEVIQPAVRQLDLEESIATSFKNDLPNILLQHLDRADSNSGITQQCLAQSNELEMMGLCRIITTSAEDGQTSQIPPASSISQTVNQSTFAVDSKPGIEVMPFAKGVFMCHIEKVRARIDNAITRKEPFIDSSVFSMPDSDQTGWIRLHLNGKTDPRHLAISVHLNAPMRAGFQGDVKFTLIDQSNHSPSVNITQICSGSLRAVDDHLGCDAFADKNHLQVDPSRYILNDQIFLTVQLRTKNAPEFPRIPNNMLRALEGH